MQEKGTTEDEMVRWHHRLNGRGFAWTPAVGDGHGDLACCGSWGRKKSHTTELKLKPLCKEPTLEGNYSKKQDHKTVDV